MPYSPCTTRLSRLSALLALLAPLGCAAVDMGTFSRSVTPAVPPAQERAAIRLSGRAVNATPEVWETREETGPPNPGSASTTEPELWVRNVSQPTLEPFLPDAKKATGAAMIIAPGGAFLELAIDREGYAVAKWLNQRGIAAFVLKYRLALSPADPKLAYEEMANWARKKVHPSPDPLKALSSQQREAADAAVASGSEAVRYLRAHASEWNLSPRHVGFIGFSAGAITALGVALQADPASRPDIVAAMYGVLPHVPAATSAMPPAFIAAAADDALSSLSWTIYSKWRTSDVPVELHILESGGHGFGMLQQGKGSDRWPIFFDEWLAARGFEKLCSLSADR